MHGFISSPTGSFFKVDENFTQKMVEVCKAHDLDLES